MEMQQVRYFLATVGELNFTKAKPGQGALRRHRESFDRSGALPAAVGDLRAHGSGFRPAFPGRGPF